MAINGWTIEPGFIGWTAVHSEFDASYEGEEDGWVGNGLSCWALTSDEVLAEIEAIEAEHPYFTEAEQ